MPSSRSDAGITSHHPRGRRSRDSTQPVRFRLPTVWMGAAGLVAVAVVAGALVFTAKSGRAGCAGQPAMINVVAAPNVSEVLRTLADQWTASGPSVNGRCVGASVSPKDSSQMAAAVGPAWDPARDGTRPVAWVPESTLWLSVAGTRPDAATMLPQQPVSLATSPLVLAVRRGLAQALGWPQRQLGWQEVIGAMAQPQVLQQAGHPELAALKMGLADPGVSTAGLASVVALLDQNATGTVSDAQLVSSLGLASVIGAMAADTSDFFAAQDPNAATGPNSLVGAFPVLERDLAAYDSGPGATNPLVPIYPAQAPIVADYPYTVLHASWVDATASATATQFQQYLQRAAAQDALASQGLRGADRTVHDTEALPATSGFRATVGPARATPGAQALSQIVIVWTSLLRATNITAVLDTSGSMGQQVPGTGKTRLQLLQQTATTGFSLLTNNTNITLWDFSLRPGSTSEYRQLVPFGPITGTVGGVSRKQAMIGAVNRLTGAGFTPLYDTVYAAFHESQKHWQANSTNAVLLITDGANELNGAGLTLADLLTRLAHEQRPETPVQVISIAVGPQADSATLAQISKVTGGRTFVARDPAQAIQTLILAFAGRLR
ncbi:MAG: Ca-activated chloride channel [Micromonosporaceae bacterium]